MPRAKREKRGGVRAEDSDDDDDDVIIRTYKNNIFYRGDIQQPQASDFCIKLLELADAYSESQNLIVHLTTNGGDLFAGISMYEALRQSKVPVHIVADACVCSAGTIVMLGAAKRFMYKTSVLMIHALSSWVHGHQKPKQLKEELQNCETLLAIMTDVYRKHTKLKSTALTKLYDTDLYIRHEQCLQLGFVDGVLD